MVGYRVENWQLGSIVIVYYRYVGGGRIVIEYCVDWRSLGWGNLSGGNNRCTTSTDKFIVGCQDCMRCAIFSLGNRDHSWNPP